MYFLNYILIISHILFFAPSTNCNLPEDCEYTF